MLARAAGLELGETGGIRCDASLRTSADGIWAAGDVCEYDSVLHGRPARVEHWDAAIEQGRHVARAILGANAPYRVVPYFFSDLADWASLEYAGIGGEPEVEEVQGSMDDGEFSVTYAAGDGRVLGCLAVGRSDDIDAAKRRIGEQA
jgi:3-phenylpropionate/trans-cinnamate dioxygenase ferredoxin reductase subunit